ncbi:Fibroblast growth factor receptor substrate 2, partial [Stegodyphus mimosarum]
MGCVFSRPEYENNPRIFHVWNVDGDGRHLKPGRIEVTDSQLILYQKGHIVVKWPLRSLRRYGFDSEVFSFECGRRCSTGPGVYAFKCKRAQVLFSILQECINNSGGGGGGGAGTSTSLASIDDQISLTTFGGERVSSLNSPPSMPNGTLPNARGSNPTVDSSGYLEPITANSHLHYPASASSSRNGGQSPGSYICIHGASSSGHPNGVAAEWSGMSSSMTSCCNLGTCGARSSSSTHHYVNNEVIEQVAGCSNSMCIVHQYVNSSVMAGELTHSCCSPPKCCPIQNENTYVNSPMMTLSPGHLPCSGGCCAVNCSNCVDFNTNYAKLDDLLKQEQSAKRHKEQHFYVNVKPDGAVPSSSSTSSKCVSGRSTPTDVLSRSGTLTSPTSPGSTKMHNSHCYANLSSPTPSEAMSSRELGAQVNYAVLDLDHSESGNNAATPPSAPNSVHSLANSPVKSPEGYAQIDFDKTVALSNSANPCPFNDDSMRKTRHNAVIPCTSMSA